MSKKKKYIITLLQWIGVMLLAIFLRKFILMPVEVIGTSMEPTYHESDRLWQSTLLKPKRFDSITFPSPRNGKQIIKRVIGLPGDTIHIEQDQLFINDKPVDEPYLAEFKASLTDDKPLTTDFSLETIQVGAAVSVPAGHYFVLGDNRRKADDSRYFGFVDEDTITGVVYFRYYPLNKIGAL